MKRKLLRQAIVDGLINAFYFIALEWFSTSIFFNFFDVNIGVYMFLTLFGVMIISMIYITYISNCEKVSELFGITFVSALTFVVCMLICFALALTPITTNVPFQRELGNGDGILLMFVAVGYLLLTVAFRLLIFIYGICVCKRKKQVQ